MSNQLKSVNLGSFSLDYLRFGRGEEALIILPGLSAQSVLGQADAIERAYAPLANDFDVYLVDQRATPPDPYPIHDIAQDTYQALRAIGLTRINLFGVSLGGMIAQDLSASHPEFVQKLVLGSTSTFVWDKPRQIIEQWITLAEQGDKF